MSRVRGGTLFETPSPLTRLAAFGSSAPSPTRGEGKNPSDRGVDQQSSYVSSPVGTFLFSLVSFMPAPSASVSSSAEKSCCR